MQWFTEKRGLIEVSFAVVLIVLMSLLFWSMPKQQGRSYDCSIAEFAPDFPPEVREECRRLRARNI